MPSQYKRWPFEDDGLVGKEFNQSGDLFCEIIKAAGTHSPLHSYCSSAGRKELSPSQLIIWRKHSIFFSVILQMKCLNYLPSVSLLAMTFSAVRANVFSVMDFASGLFTTFIHATHILYSLAFTFFHLHLVSKNYN